MRLPWDEITDTLCDGASEVLLAAPYIKTPALLELLRLVPSDANLVCVSRWAPNDILLGSTDVEVRTVILKEGGQFRLHPRLHAKYYRFDDSVFVGSANLTDAGLSRVGAGNLEVLSRPHCSFSYMDFELQLLKESREISEREYEGWKAMSLMGADHRMQSRRFAEDYLSEWRPRTRDPEYIWLVYTEHPGQIVSPVQRHLAQQDLAALHVPGELDRDCFDMWVRTSLLSSPFVNSVMKVDAEVDDVAIARQDIASLWMMSESEAGRALETTQYWLQWYNL